MRTRTPGGTSDRARSASPGPTMTAESPESLIMCAMRLSGYSGSSGT